MNSLKRLLPAVVALFLWVVPNVADAQSLAPLYGALGLGSGALATPTGTVVRVFPPKGAAVMLYAGNSVKGWWTSPGMVDVKPGRVHGVIATRGTQVLFHSRLIFRPGVTDIGWSNSNVPTIAYAPAPSVRPPVAARPTVTAPARPATAPGYSQARRAASRVRPKAASFNRRPATTPGPAASTFGKAKRAAASPARQSAGQGASPAAKRAAAVGVAKPVSPAASRYAGTTPYSRLLRRLAVQRSDRAKLRLVRAYAARHRLTTMQAAAVAKRFRSLSYRRYATRLMRTSHKSFAKSRRRSFKRPG